MRVFLLDLWLDLREKRLAPVAIALLAAIIIVPIVLAKGTSPAPTPPQTGTTAAAPAAPVVQSQTQAGPVESKLQTFSPRDPFEPTARLASAGTGTTTSGGTGATGGTGGSTGTTTTTTGTGNGTTGGGVTGNGPSTTPGNNGNGNTGNTTGQTKTTLFTYTVDARFGPGGNVKLYKGVKRLDLLPDSKNPKLDFLGVTTTGKTAVFLVSSDIGVDTAGGKCQPSPDNCTFLYLRPTDGHDEALLTDTDGTVYHLRLINIHRVTVSSANGTSNSGTGNSGSGKGNSNKRSPAFTGSADKSSSDTVPGDGETPPGEPSNRSSFEQMFADSAN